jgi:hypothetical protein
MRRLLYSALLLVTCFHAFSQEEFVEPSKFLTRFSFVQMTGGVIILQGQFNSFKDTLNFILDTGSGGISLDSKELLLTEPFAALQAFAMLVFSTTAHFICPGSPSTV